MAIDGTSQLERMGSELRCPICLSLFKQAASLSCNHCFCSSCILQSMRRASCCPICKVPATRREVRSAPQMDSLVSIFKGMEASAGTSFFQTQCTSSQLGSGGDKGDLQKLTKPKTKRGKTREQISNDAAKLDAIEISPKKKRRRVQTGTHFQNMTGPKPATTSGPQVLAQGVVRAKKRIQVPQSSTYVDHELEEGDDHAQIQQNDGLAGNSPEGAATSPLSGSHISDGPICSSFISVRNSINSGSGLKSRNDVDAAVSSRDHLKTSQGIDAISAESPKVRCHQKEGSSAHHSKPGIILGCGLGGQNKLAPFFWLPNEVLPTQDEVPTQTQSLARPVRPAFSDLKDSDDEQSIDDVQQLREIGRVGVADASSYDSDAFAWTQRPCSPELSSSPGKFLKSSISQRCGETYKSKIVQDVAGKVGSHPLAIEEEDVEATQTPQVLQEPARMKGTLSRCSRIRKRDRGKSPVSNVRRSLKGKMTHDSSPRPLRPTKRRGRPRSGPSSSNPSPNDPITKSHEEKQSISADCLSNAQTLVAKQTHDHIIDILEEDFCHDIFPQEKRRSEDEGQIATKADGRNKLKRKTYGEPVYSPNDEEHACMFCGTSTTSEIAGPIVNYSETFASQGRTTIRAVLVHEKCAVWAPDVYFENDKPINLASELRRGEKIKCNSCGRKGAALGCCNKRCKRSFHYPCARNLKGCKWDMSNFVMFCPQHAHCKFPVSRRPGTKNEVRLLTIPEAEIEEEPTVSLEKPNSRSYEHGARPDKIASEVASATAPLLQKWSPGPACKWVLCGSGLNSKLKAEVASFASLTGASLTKKWSPAVTHVITGTDERGAAKRTLKYLMAILEGKWVVTVEWMLQCIASKHIVPEEPYVVQLDVNGVLGGPLISRRRAAAKKPKLFGGLSLYFCGDFTHISKTDLQSLAIAGGGVVLHRRPLPLDTSASPNRARTTVPRAGETIVLYNGEPTVSRSKEGKEKSLAQRVQEANAVAIPAGAHLFPCSWLLDSVASCTLLPQIPLKNR